MDSGFGTKISIAMPGSGSSIGVVNIDEENWSTDMTIGPAPVVATISFNLEAIKADILIQSKLHQRPLSDQEYGDYMDLLTTGMTVTGEIVYKYQKVAVARIIKENYLKFFPGASLDPIINQLINETAELNSAFIPTYNNELDRYRDNLINKTAEDMFEFYTLKEKQRLKETGVAFLGVGVKKTSSSIFSPFTALLKSNLAHPMLRYGLIRRK